MKLLLRVILDGVIVYAILVLALWALQGRLIYQSPAASVPWGKLTVSRPEGALHGWIAHPQAATAVVVFGGNAMAVGKLGPVLAMCTPAAIYTVPYRGYEGQFGTPNEKDLVADGVALVRQAQQTHAFVVILGISLGTGVATQVAAQTHPERVVLVTPYDRLDRVAQDHLPFVPVAWLMRDHYNSLAAVGKLSGTPVALIQADRDEVVGAARTRALALAIPGGPVVWSHVDSTHNGVWGQPALCQFIASQVAAAVSVR